MTDQAEPHHATDRADNARRDPICHRLFSIKQAAEFARVPVEGLATGSLPASSRCIASEMGSGSTRSNLPICSRLNDRRCCSASSGQRQAGGEQRPGPSSVQQCHLEKLTMMSTIFR
jgi:hypothetical protein